MSYVDGFVLCIPKSKLKAYKKMATEGYKTWMKLGALDYKECMIDDAAPQHVTFTFGKMAQAKPDEVVFFSYIVFKNRKHRDAVNKKVMAYFDKKYKDKQQDMPFDMNRFAMAGFKTVVGK
jgi:uncharacterized protein YbaA (DUF1428 family)